MSDSLDRRSSQFVHPAAQVPEGHLADRADCISLVEFELRDDAYPAIDPFDIAGDGSRHLPASRHPVGARGRQTPAVGTECQPMDRAPMVQGWADRQAGVGTPEPDGSVMAPSRDNCAIGVERDAVDVLAMRERLADRFAGLGIPEPSRAVWARCDDGTAQGAIAGAVDFRPMGKLGEGRPSSRCSTV